MEKVAQPSAEAPAAVYKVPQRGLFDVVATDDVISLLILVRGDNPFDISPGMELIRYKRYMKRLSDMAYLENSHVEGNLLPQIETAQIPRSRDARGNSAVHVAAGFGFSCMVEVLVSECGCAVEDYNSSGLKPLHLAAFHGHADCVRLLRDLGADLLSPTQCNPPSTTRPYGSLCGRTTLFLAHSKQHATVVDFLLPFYRDFIDTMFGDKTGAEAWKTAASEQDMKSLSLLLDALECHGTAGGALPVSIPFDVGDALCEALPAVLEAILPPSHQMTYQQLFVFERLIHLGYLTETTIVGSSGTVLERVLDTAQVQAWCVLVKQGLVQPHKCSLAAVHGSEPGGKSEADLRALVQEAKAHFSYQVAKKTYMEKGGNSSRRKHVLSRRKAWRELANDLKQRSLSPARGSQL
ncbi:hypothetical protein JKF63_02029 [Porcisia hertigi]|uniref:Uncharacterized protein n=1 Tax=Porcisia hertigi TaxID=2761500 RepID=A0A836L2M9_9TRYP|nr:hypothetical protein JKF63_02029 [Porcisia hertigi]